MVLSVDPEAQRISLSLKALEARAVAPKAEEAGPDRARDAGRRAEEAQDPARAAASAGPSSGEQFGLKW